MVGERRLHVREGAPVPVTLTAAQFHADPAAAYELAGTVDRVVVLDSRGEPRMTIARQRDEEPALDVETIRETAYAEGMGHAAFLARYSGGDIRTKLQIIDYLERAAEAQRQQATANAAKRAKETTCP